MTSTVPKAVRKAAERAEKAHAAHYGDPQDTDPKPDGEDPAPGTQGEQAPAKAEETTATAQPEQKPADDGGEWKRKYEALVAEVGADSFKSLQGKYSAEVPRMAAEIRAYKAEKQDLERQVQELKQQLENVTTPAPQQQDTGSIKEKVERIRDEFGDDAADLLAGLIQAQNAGGQQNPTGNDELTTLRKEVDTLKHERQLTAKQQFDKDLLEAVPDWQAVNVDPAFHAWLAEHDPLSGAMRQELLDDAAKRLDARRVAAIFNAFKGPQKQATTSNQNAPKERVVSPPRGGAQQQDKQTEPAATVGDLQRLTHEYQRGKWRGRESEFHKLYDQTSRAVYGNRQSA